MSVWFTADTHFFHKNIIKYSHRPYSTVEEMNADMVARWNARVKPGDLVYHLGDFAWYRKTIENDLIALIQSLNGQIHFVKGNHDHQKAIRIYRGWKTKFVKIKDYERIRVDNQKIVLFHYALRVWHGSHHGAWQLYGHSHGSLIRDYETMSFDVGVDCWDYQPISFEQVAEEMKKHTFVSVDHHGSVDGNEEIEQSIYQFPQGANHGGTSS